MSKIIKDTSKIQKRISYRLIENALKAKEIGIKIDTRKAPISLHELRRFLIDQQ